METIVSGMYDGCAMIEILPEGRMLNLGFLPKFAPTSDRAYWTEIRSYKHYMVIGSELQGNGIQIFDMRKLLDIKPADAPVIFKHDKDLTGHFNSSLPLGRSHNVVINEEAQYGVAVGVTPRDQGCKGGLHFFDLKDPSKPVDLGCNGDDGYVHDAQCLIYRGPDSKYVGRDICYGYNEDTLTIYDVTDKRNSTIISRTSYEGAEYTHQGWVNDANNQEWLFMDDEYDEERTTGPAADGYPVTYIWDIKSLENPKQTGIYKGSVRSIDHNQYVNGDLIYQSNYGAGVRVYDVSSVPQDPTGNGVCEIAYFDIYPEDDDAPGGGVPAFSGSWSSYAYFKSGYIFVNTIERGGYDGKDICYGYNEDSLTIYDVSDKFTTNIISRTSYEGVNYTHQGWVTDVNNQEFLLMNDERDERYRAGPASDQFPVVYIWDIRDLANPKQTGIYKYKTKAIDHNLYIRDGIAFQSMYGSGYSLLDVSSVGPSDPTGSGICEAAWIDIYPEDDNLPGGGIVEFVGSWSSYGWFPSGHHFINTIERGAFVVKPTSLKCPPPPVCNADNCLRALRSNSVKGRLEESQDFCAGYTANLIKESSVLPAYAQKACTGDAVSRVSSACSCLPTPTGI
ncbi:hypothetical protein VdG1_04210 [Verticillium dahliae VDG1]|nr:hypothetical protein VdG1_04210 [Verticillium dahliae VDG1]